MWFAWKYLPLWYQQQLNCPLMKTEPCCDLLENIYLCGINNNRLSEFPHKEQLWFAWKYLPLWYQQQRRQFSICSFVCCDLLENIYLCGINNNAAFCQMRTNCVVICLKISTFVVSTTTITLYICNIFLLWFAWKYLPLWYQQQLLRNMMMQRRVVICLKISTFVVSTTTPTERSSPLLCCDLLENIYLCGINNNIPTTQEIAINVVICLKISTFVVSTTTRAAVWHVREWLWFAWKYLPLWYQQQPSDELVVSWFSCDLLENIYLCGINNNRST